MGLRARVEDVLNVRPSDLWGRGRGYRREKPEAEPVDYTNFRLQERFQNQLQQSESDETSRREGIQTLKQYYAAALHLVSLRDVIHKDEESINDIKSRIRSLRQQGNNVSRSEAALERILKSTLDLSHDSLSGGMGHFDGLMEQVVGSYGLSLEDYLSSNQAEPLRKLKRLQESFVTLRDLDAEEPDDEQVLGVVHQVIETLNGDLSADEFIDSADLDQSDETTIIELQYRVLEAVSNKIVSVVEQMESHLEAAVEIILSQVEQEAKSEALKDYLRLLGVSDQELHGSEQWVGNGIDSAVSLVNRLLEAIQQAYNLEQSGEDYQGFRVREVFEEGLELAKLKKMILSQHRSIQQFQTTVASELMTAGLSATDGSENHVSLTDTLNQICSMELNPDTNTEEFDQLVPLLSSLILDFASAVLQSQASSELLRRFTSQLRGINAHLVMYHARYIDNRSAVRQTTMHPDDVQKVLAEAELMMDSLKALSSSALTARDVYNRTPLVPPNKLHSTAKELVDKVLAGQLETIKQRRDEKEADLLGWIDNG